MWSDWLVFCDCGFSLSALWWGRIRGLWKLPDGRDWLRGKLGLVLMDGAMFSKSLIQFSVDGWGCVPSLLFTWGQIMVEVMKTMVTSFKRSHACTAALSAPDPAAGHRWPMPLPETPRHSRTSLHQSLVGTLSPGVWCTQASVEPSKSLFPQSCVTSGSSMVGLMVTSSKRSSLVAQTVKHLPTIRETQVRSLGWEDPLEKETATHSSTLAWKIPWTEEPGRLQSMGSQRVQHDWATSLSSKRAYVIPRSTTPRAPALQQSTVDPYVLRRHSNTVLSQSLWGLCVLVCTRYVWALWASLAGMGSDSKCDFTWLAGLPVAKNMF